MYSICKVRNCLRTKTCHANPPAKKLRKSHKPNYQSNKHLSYLPGYQCSDVGKNKQIDKVETFGLENRYSLPKKLKSSLCCNEDQSLRKIDGSENRGMWGIRWENCRI